jgi:hypothetical protein
MGEISEEDFDRIDFDKIAEIAAVVEDLKKTGRLTYKAFEVACEETLQLTGGIWDPLEAIVVAADAPEEWLQKFAEEHEAEEE